MPSRERPRSQQMPRDDPRACMLLTAWPRAWYTFGRSSGSPVPKPIGANKRRNSEIPGAVVLESLSSMKVPRAL
jgi:hypothetical protein